MKPMLIKSQSLRCVAGVILLCFVTENATSGISPADIHSFRSLFLIPSQTNTHPIVNAYGHDPALLRSELRLDELEGKKNLPQASNHMPQAGLIAGSGARRANSELRFSDALSSTIFSSVVRKNDWRKIIRRSATGTLGVSLMSVGMCALGFYWNSPMSGLFFSLIVGAGLLIHSKYASIGTNEFQLVSDSDQFHIVGKTGQLTMTPFSVGASTEETKPNPALRRLSVKNPGHLNFYLPRGLQFTFDGIRMLRYDLSRFFDVKFYYVRVRAYSYRRNIVKILFHPILILILASTSFLYQAGIDRYAYALWLEWDARSALKNSLLFTEKEGKAIALIQDVEKRIIAGKDTKFDRLLVLKLLRHHPFKVIQQRVALMIQERKAPREAIAVFLEILRNTAGNLNEAKELSLGSQSMVWTQNVTAIRSLSILGARESLQDFIKVIKSWQSNWDSFRFLGSYSLYTLIDLWDGSDPEARDLIVWLIQNGSPNEKDRANRIRSLLTDNQIPPAKKNVIFNHLTDPALRALVEKAQRPVKKSLPKSELRLDELEGRAESSLAGQGAPGAIGAAKDQFHFEPRGFDSNDSLGTIRGVVKQTLETDFRHLSQLGLDRLTVRFEGESSVNVPYDQWLSWHLVDGGNHGYWVHMHLNPRQVPPAQWMMIGLLFKLEINGSDLQLVEVMAEPYPHFEEVATFMLLNEIQMSDEMRNQIKEMGARAILAHKGRIVSLVMKHKQFGNVIEHRLFQAREEGHWFNLFAMHDGAGNVMPKDARYQDVSSKSLSELRRAKEQRTYRSREQWIPLLKNLAKKCRDLDIPATPANAAAQSEGETKVTAQAIRQALNKHEISYEEVGMKREFRFRRDWIVYLKMLVEKCRALKIPATPANAAAQSNGEINKEGILSVLAKRNISYKTVRMKRERAEPRSRRDWIVYLKALVKKLPRGMPATAKNVAAQSKKEVTAQGIRIALGQHRILYHTVGMVRAPRGGLRIRKTTTETKPRAELRRDQQHFEFKNEHEWKFTLQFAPNWKTLNNHQLVLTVGEQKFYLTIKSTENFSGRIMLPGTDSEDLLPETDILSIERELQGQSRTWQRIDRDKNQMQWTFIYSMVKMVLRHVWHDREESDRPIDFDAWKAESTVRVVYYGNRTEIYWSYPSAGSRETKPWFSIDHANGRIVRPGKYTVPVDAYFIPAIMSLLYASAVIHFDPELNQAMSDQFSIALFPAARDITHKRSQVWNLSKREIIFLKLMSKDGWRPQVLAKLNEWNSADQNLAERVYHRMRKLYTHVNGDIIQKVMGRFRGDGLSHNPKGPAKIKAYNIAWRMFDLDGREQFQRGQSELRTQLTEIIMKGLARFFEYGNPLFVVGNLRGENSENSFNDRNVFFDLRHVNIYPINFFLDVFQTFAKRTELGAEVFQNNRPLALIRILTSRLRNSAHGGMLTMSAGFINIYFRKISVVDTTHLNRFESSDGSRAELRSVTFFRKVYSILPRFSTHVPLKNAYLRLFQPPHGYLSELFTPAERQLIDEVINRLHREGDYSKEALLAVLQRLIPGEKDSEVSSRVVDFKINHDLGSSLAQFLYSGLLILGGGCFSVFLFHGLITLSWFNIAQGLGGLFVIGAGWIFGSYINGLIFLYQFFDTTHVRVPALKKHPNDRDKLEYQSKLESIIKPILQELTAKPNASESPYNPLLSPNQVHELSRIFAELEEGGKYSFLTLERMKPRFNIEVPNVETLEQESDFLEQLDSLIPLVNRFQSVASSIVTNYDKAMSHLDLLRRRSWTWLAGSAFVSVLVLMYRPGMAIYMEALTVLTFLSLRLYIFMNQVQLSDLIARGTEWIGAWETPAIGLPYLNGEAFYRRAKTAIETKLQAEEQNASLKAEENGKKTWSFQDKISSMLFIGLFGAMATLALDVAFAFAGMPPVLRWISHEISGFFAFLYLASFAVTFGPEMVDKYKIMFRSLFKTRSELRSGESMLMANQQRAELRQSREINRVLLYLKTRSEKYINSIARKFHFKLSENDFGGYEEFLLSAAVLSPLWTVFSAALLGTQYFNSAYDNWKVLIRDLLIVGFGKPLLRMAAAIVIKKRHPDSHFRVIFALGWLPIPTSVIFPLQIADLWAMQVLKKYGNKHIFNVVRHTTYLSFLRLMLQIQKIFRRPLHRSIAFRVMLAFGIGGSWFAYRLIEERGVDRARGKLVQFYEENLPKTKLSIGADKIGAYRTDLAHEGIQYTVIAGVHGASRGAELVLEASEPFIADPKHSLIVLEGLEYQKKRKFSHIDAKILHELASRSSIPVIDPIPGFGDPEVIKTVQEELKFSRDEILTASLYSELVELNDASRDFIDRLTRERVLEFIRLRSQVYGVDFDTALKLLQTKASEIQKSGEAVEQYTKIVDRVLASVKAARNEIAEERFMQALKKRPHVRRVLALVGMSHRQVFDPDAPVIFPVLTSQEMKRVLALVSLRSELRSETHVSDTLLRTRRSELRMRDSEENKTKENKKDLLFAAAVRNLDPAARVDIKILHYIKTILLALGSRMADELGDIVTTTDFMNAKVLEVIQEKTRTQDVAVMSFAALFLDVLSVTHKDVEVKNVMDDLFAVRAQTGQLTNPLWVRALRMSLLHEDIGLFLQSSRAEPARLLITRQYSVGISAEFNKVKTHISQRRYKQAADLLKLLVRNGLSERVRRFLHDLDTNEPMASEELATHITFHDIKRLNQEAGRSELREEYRFLTSAGIGVFTSVLTGELEYGHLIPISRDFRALDDALPRWQRLVISKLLTTQIKDPQLEIDNQRIMDAVGSHIGREITDLNQVKAGDFLLIAGPPRFQVEVAGVIPSKVPNEVKLVSLTHGHIAVKDLSASNPIPSGYVYRILPVSEWKPGDKIITEILKPHVRLDQKMRRLKQRGWRLKASDPLEKIENSLTKVLKADLVRLSKLRPEDFGVSFGVKFYNSAESDLQFSVVDGGELGIWLSLDIFFRGVSRRKQIQTQLLVKLKREGNNFMPGRLMLRIYPQLQEAHSFMLLDDVGEFQELVDQLRNLAGQEILNHTDRLTQILGRYDPSKLHHEQRLFRATDGKNWFNLFAVEASVWTAHSRDQRYKYMPKGDRSELRYAQSPSLDSMRETRFAREGTATRTASSTPVRRVSTADNRSLTSAMSSRSGTTISVTVRNSDRNSSINTATSRAVNSDFSINTNPPSHLVSQLEGAKNIPERERPVNISIQNKHTENPQFFALEHGALDFENKKLLLDLERVRDGAFRTLHSPTQTGRRTLGEFLGVDLISDVSESDVMQTRDIIGLLPNLGRMPDIVKAVAGHAAGKNEILIFAGEHEKTLIERELLKKFPESFKKVRVVTRVDAKHILGTRRNAKLIAFGLPQDAGYADRLTHLLQDVVQVEKKIASLERIELMLQMNGIAVRLTAQLRALWAQAVAA